MPKLAFEPCIPIRGTRVPASKDWIHEIKHDGYRLIVQRDGKRVRLFTRNGHDWSDRYPLIVEAALRNRASSFVVDGEAVILGVDGNSDFDALHSGRHNEEVQLYAFDMLAGDGDDLRQLPLSMRSCISAPPCPSGVISTTSQQMPLTSPSSDRKSPCSGYALPIASKSASRMPSTG